MRVSQPVFRGLLLGLLALPGQSRAQTINASDAMANHATDASTALTGSAIPAGPELHVGRKSYYANPNSNHLLHDVVPFQLPDLGSGTFTDVRVAFRAQGEGTWNIPINLWAIPGSRASSTTQGGDVRSATLNHTQFGSLIMRGFFHRETTRDAYASTPVQGAESARLAAWLNAAYQDGANHGRFVFMRLSPQALTPDEAGPDEQDSGFAVGAKGFVNAQWRPYLSYTFVEAPAGAPVIHGFSASNDEIGETGTVTLTWSVTGASSVEIWPELGTVTASGSAAITPGFTTTYTLYANNASGERVATAGVTVIPPAPAEVPGELYDGGFRTAPATGAVVGGLDASGDPRVHVGRRAGATDVDHLVIPFRLPALGQGIFQNAKLRVDLTAGDGVTPGIDINLFGIPEARTLPVPLATDVSQGGQDHRSRGSLIETAWINNATPQGPLSTQPNSAGSVALSAWLTDAYANGANAGKYVFLRLSPAALVPAQGTGVRIGAANGSTDSRPLLTYDFVENGLLPPAIDSFTATPSSISNGWSATLAWSVSGDETTVSIDQGIGTVAAGGTATVSPSTSTTYTITAQNASGTRTRTVTVGTGPFRYFRFVPVAVRAGTTVQISEFQLMRNGTRLSGATATNPGGNFPGNEGPDKANDNLTHTKWLDFNRQPLLLDFGAPTVVDGYRFATANDAETRDPVSWRVEGSHDGSYWRVLDERANFATPVQRATFVGSLPLPFVGDFSGTPAAPGIDHFTASSGSLIAGEQATLSWSVNGAAGARISPGMGPVAASGSLVVAPATTTTYSIAAGNSSGSATRSLRIVVRKAYRWYRFVPLKTRVVTADAVALAEFGMLADGIPIPGASASNPGGANPPFNLAGNATDDDFFSQWSDTNKKPLVLDFGVPVLANGYRFAIGDWNPRDPLSWRVEGSPDGSAWAILDQKTDFATPTDGEQFVAPFALQEPAEASASASGVPPRVLFFSLTPGRSEASLVWESRAGAIYSIETSATLAGPSWSVVETGVPSGGAITSRTFQRGTALRQFFRVREHP